MNRSFRTLVVAAAAIFHLAEPGALGAQEGVVAQRSQVVSANPFGLILELFNAEYERTVSTSSTAGVGGSFLRNDEQDYLNADLFWRFYPGGEPLTGWAFGGKVGVTDVPDQGTYFGYGFDVNRSWILGENDNFYVGAGFGLKRLVGAGDGDFDLEVIPTIRIINVGIAF